MEQNTTGLIHIYCGNGKGKTTAAVGLAVRAAGAGKQVIFAQFFKNGSSCEIKSLKKLETVHIMHCNTVPGRYSKMSKSEKTQAKSDYSKFFDDILIKAQNTDILILDEVISACNHTIIQEKDLVDFLQNKPERLEVVLTGRDPSDTLLKLADYATEMRKVRHPYDRGIKARRGIEF